MLKSSAVVVNVRGGQPKAPLVTLLVTGIGVQFAWEAALLITGIRPTGVKPLLINSLIETNLGMPYIYMIFQAYKKTKIVREPAGIKSSAIE